MKRKPLEEQLELILRQFKKRENGMDYEKAIQEIRALFKRTYHKEAT